MKLLLLLAFLHMNFENLDCGVIVKESRTESIAGKNIGFYVLFQNNSQFTVDAVEYNVKFYNTFGDLIASKDFSWQSSDIDSPFGPNETTWNLRKSWIDGASKIKIKIRRVHFTNGKTCWY